MKQLNALCAILVELATISVVLLALLGLISGATTKHLSVAQTIDEEHALLSGDTKGLWVGQTLPLYRFNPDWKLPIGEARIDRITSFGAEISVDPGTMRWPLGRHGSLMRQEDGTWRASVGSDQGFQKGDLLQVFRGREHIGSATITRLSKGTSQVEVSGNIPNVAGLVVTEYRYATQAAWQPHAVSIVESLLIGLCVVAYALWYVIMHRSPLVALGEGLGAIPSSSRLLFWPLHIVTIVPFAWFMAKMPLFLIAYLIEWVAKYTDHAISLRFIAEAIFPFAFVVILLLSCGFLFWKRQSPILALWRLMSYKRQSKVGKVRPLRGALLWALHLLIVYVFGLTLIQFLIGDIAAARAIGPHPASVQELADFWKYVIWSLTVVGVLVGYGYSVVSIFWGRFIRNLDFTITGWLTNGFCYPFLGVVIWQIAPSFTGPDPLFATGPLAIFALILGTLLNLLYMLSIWNLGTKFDLMTDKGVRWGGFYSVIRHPNYTLEAMMFFVTELVGLSSVLAWAGISMYFFLYWVRSEREDNFMWYSNPEYSEYQKATPYKFIRGIY